VRRSAVPESFQQIAEARFHHLRRDLQHLLENGLLHIRLVDTNRAAAQFPPINDYVVMLATDLFWVGGQERDVLGNRRSERMMTGIPAVLLLIETQERKIDHPEEIKSIGRNLQPALRFQKLGAVEADFAQDFAGSQPLISG